ncbi:MAG: hypothetical protein JWR52_3495 [Marmoricola sp.]|nr:hypothetical protein [Marmoricola sp.]
MNDYDAAQPHLRRAVQILYSGYRETDDPVEAMYNALNMTLAYLRWLATEHGFTPDWSEYAESATDIEFVTREEFDLRPEALWFQITRQLIYHDLDDADTMEAVRQFRKQVSDQGGLFPGSLRSRIGDEQ